MTDNHLEWTGERYLPEIGGAIALEHIHRYLMARELAKDKDVLDIACGEGYGSAMLAEIARHVSGIDIAVEAVAHATEKYQKENLQFLVGSCAEIPLPDDSIDLVVSFETIEHHDQHQEMMQEIKRVLRPDGVLIISSPDKCEFSDIGQQGTHYHVKELYRREFEELIESFFSCSVFLGQRVLYGSAILSDELSAESTTYLQNEGSFRSTSGLPRPLYILAIASDVDTPKISVGILEQPVHESDAVRQIHNECVQMHQKVGERDATIEELHQKVGERGATIEELHQKVGERGATIEELHHNIAEHEGKMKFIQKNINTVDSTIVSLEKEKKENKERAEELSRHLVKILQSWSWRITKPLRFVRRIAASQSYIAARHMASNASHTILHSLPVRWLEGKLKNKRSD